MTTVSSPGSESQLAKPRIALSFEAGGDPMVSGQMLDVLRDEGVVASIFILGNWAEANPDLVKRIAAEGHELGNHSYSHPVLTDLDEQQVRLELQKTSDICQELTGQRAFPWLRPPYGALDERVRTIALDEGYRLIMRDAVDGGHWPGQTTGDRIVQRTLDNAYDGASIAYHINNPTTVQVLPDIIRKLREADFEFVRLSDLADLSEYAERRSSQQDVRADPGFLQVMQANTRAWSMNLLDYGSRKAVPEGEIIDLADSEQYAISMISGAAGDDLLALPAANVDRHILLMQGRADCLFYGPDDEQPRLRLMAGAGDMALWSRSYRLRVRSLAEPWLLLVIKPKGA